jgi:hypothetical protein
MGATADFAMDTLHPSDPDLVHSTEGAGFQSSGEERGSTWCSVSTRGATPESVLLRCPLVVKCMAVWICEDIMTTKLLRHISVFAVALGLAALFAFLMPLSIDPRDVFFVFLALFFIYLGISTLIDMRGSANGRKRKN